MNETLPLPVLSPVDLREHRRVFVMLGRDGREHVHESKPVWVEAIPIGSDPTAVEEPGPHPSSSSPPIRVACVGGCFAAASAGTPTPSVVAGLVALDGSSPEPARPVDPDWFLPRVHEAHAGLAGLGRIAEDRGSWGERDADDEREGQGEQECEQDADQGEGDADDPLDDHRAGLRFLAWCLIAPLVVAIVGLAAVSVWGVLWFAGMIV